MKIEYQTPELEATSSTGKLKWWRGLVGSDGGNVYTFTCWCEELKGGGRSEWCKGAAKLIVGKHLGKANETSPLVQAISEIDSAAKKQQDKGYYPTGSSSDGKPVLPMLAHTFKDKKHKVEYPCYVSPKADGTRALCYHGNMWSRKGIPYIPEVVAHLVEAVGDQNVVLDGELILPEQYDLQDTVTAIKKFREDSSKLLYRVYDLVSDDPFRLRYKRLTDIVATINHPQVILLPSYPINSEADVSIYHDKFFSEGWEGAMVRWGESGYKAGYRSDSLLKVKSFLEEEFEIIAANEAKVAHVGAVFACRLPNGNTVAVTPKFSHAQRRHWLSHPEEVLGKQLTVRFQRWTQDGSLFIPVGVAVREADIQG